MRRLVVGVDGTTGSDNALRWAVEDADSRGLSVVAVLALPPAGGLTGPDALEAGRGVLRASLERAGVADSPLVVERRVVCAEPVHALVQESTRAAALVVGARGRGLAARALLGSVSRSCAQRAYAPVVVVHDLAVRRDDPVVVGVDGSDSSVAALRWAAAEAQARDTLLRVLHAWRDVPPPYFGPPVPPVPERSMQAIAAEVLEVSLSRAFGPRPPANLEAVPVRGTSDHALLDAAQVAQLLVVGNRGHGGPAELLLGSTSLRCLTHARCPVAVVREPHL